MSEVLPNKLKGTHLVNFHGRQTDLKYGYENPVVKINNHLLNRQAYTHDLQLLQQQFSYLTSYVNIGSADTVSVSTVRDVILGYCLYFLRRSSQGYDISNITLTNHAKLYNDYRAETVKYIKTEVKGKSIKDTKGLYGTLAWYGGLDVNNATNPITYVAKTLKSYWRSLGLDPMTTVQERLIEIDDRLEFSTVDWDYIENHLKELLQYSRDRAVYLDEGSLTNLKKLRRNLYTSQMLDNFRLRVLLGEYNNTIREIVRELDKRNGLVEQRVRKFSSPGGFTQVYLALVVEGLLRSVAALQSLEDINIEYQVFIESGQTYREVRQEVAKGLLMASDALGLLGIFKTLKECYALSCLVLKTAHKIAVDRIPSDSVDRVRSI